MTDANDADYDDGVHDNPNPGAHLISLVQFPLRRGSKSFDPRTAVT